MVLKEFTIQAISKGSDDMGKVHMQVEYDGQMYYGFGANTDIIAASVEAYIDCINKFKKIIIRNTKMANTLFDKIWDAHVVQKVEEGPTQLYIDRLYCHEVTSPQAFAGLRARGGEKSFVRIMYIVCRITILRHMTRINRLRIRFLKHR